MKGIHSTYKSLEEEQVQAIHDRSLDLLERVGIMVKSRQALDLLQKAGCDISNPKRIKIPRELVMQGLDKMPHKVDVYDRNGNLAMELEAGRTYFGTGGDCPNIYDFETGERRPSTRKDIAAAARFADALPNIDFVMSSVIASDMPPEVRHVRQYEGMLLNTTKPCMPGCDNPRDVETMIKMAAVVVDGIDTLRERPPVIFPSGTIEPLSHHEDGIGKALMCAEYGIPFTYHAAGNLLGSQTPVTLAGALIQGNASTLAGWTIIQLAHPGAKIIGGGVCPAFDMQYGTYAYGSPEFSLSGAAKADICRFYNVPGFGFAGATDSKVLDAQAGMEYAFSLYFTAMSGMSLIHDSGYLDGGATNSFESVLFADEVISIVKRLLTPIAFNETTIALDIIDEVGPGGSYLTHEHTFSNFRQHLWTPRYVYRGRYADWEGKGAKDMRQRLNEAAKKILDDHAITELPGEVKSEIAEIVEKHS